VKNKTGKKMKVSKYDNGQAYTSKEFDSFSREAWIKRVNSALEPATKWGY
jgi:hypothetical protein